MAGNDSSLEMVDMSSHLYGRYAHYYEVIAKDRDFGKQLELIKATLPQPDPRGRICFLELFAGPAYHAIIASQDPSYDVWAIDSSDEMKRIAVSAGFPNSQNYIVNRLPNAIARIPQETKIDCVICLRYSLGYLGIREVFQLLTRLKPRLSHGGKVFVELHEISSVINSMRSTDIQLRTGHSNRGEEVECVWPDGDIGWRRESYLADMKITLKIRSRSGETTETSFVSMENLHSAELLGFLAELCGLSYALVSDKYGLKDIDSYFKHSVLVELANEHRFV